MSATRWTAELDLDELYYVLKRVPSLNLPTGFESEAFGSAYRFDDEDGPVDDACLIWSAESSLDARALLVAGAHPRGSKVVAPALVTALSLHSIAECSFRVSAWMGNDETLEVVSVSGDACASLRLIRQRADGRDLPGSARVVVSLFSVDALVAHLVSSVDDEWLDATRARASVEVGLNESRAIVDALDRGDSRMASSIATELGVADSLGLFSELAGPIGSGLTIEASARAGLPFFVGSWVRGSESWMKVNIRPGMPPVTADSLTTDGRITISRCGVDGIRAELLALVVGLMRGHRVG